MRVRTEKGGLQCCQNSYIEKLTFRQKLAESESVNHVGEGPRAYQAEGAIFPCLWGSKNDNQDSLAEGGFAGDVVQPRIMAR